MNLPEETRALIDAFLGGCATPEQQAKLDRMLAADPEVRAAYCNAVEADALLAAWAANRKEAEAAQAVLQDVERDSTPARTASDGVPSPLRIHQSPFRFRPTLTLAAAAAVLMAVGVLAYRFSTRQGGEGPATLIRTTDAQWTRSPARAGDALAPGQRLALTHGTAEIAFSGQAKVLLTAPAELEIVDAGDCRLASGKLTAHVPQPARGFKVHTPDGTVTDLGTDFGVLVSLAGAAANIAQQSPSTANTEVHVFRGEVEVASLAGAATAKIPAPQPHKLTAGQAATLTAREFKPLPAADPFRFAIDQLTGQPRQVLLAEDFESLGAGADGPHLGEWKTAYNSGQGRKVIVIDPADPARADTMVDPLPPVGHSAVEFRCSQRIVKSLYPLLSRNLEAKFPARCKLLVECDILPRTRGVEPAIALNADKPLRLAPGIALSREADPAAPQIEWRKDQWYRLRVVWDMEGGAPQGATVERLVWYGTEGWVRDVSVRLPSPKHLAGPLTHVCFGFPAPIAGQAGGTYWLDNVQIEVLTEK